MPPHEPPEPPPPPRAIVPPITEFERKRAGWLRSILIVGWIGMLVLFLWMRTVDWGLSIFVFGIVPALLVFCMILASLAAVFHGVYLITQRSGARDIGVALLATGGIPLVLAVLNLLLALRS